MNGGDEDTSVIQREQRLTSDAQGKELFSNDLEQGHLALFKSGTSSRRPTTDSSGRVETSSGESHAREMQSVTARTVYQMVSLAASTTAVALARSFGEIPGYDKCFQQVSKQ